MANKLDPMDIKQILVLIKDGFSNRKIGSTLGISRNTVNNYVQQFNSSGYNIGELLNFDENRLNELFTGKTTIDTSRHDDLMRYLERINAARSHPEGTYEFIKGPDENLIFHITDTQRFWSLTKYLVIEVY
jgi:predicted transcriptional regulator